MDRRDTTGAIETFFFPGGGRGVCVLCGQLLRRIGGRSHTDIGDAESASSILIDLLN